MEYSVGTTCFGSFPGVLSKLNGFSAVTVTGKLMENKPTRKRSRERISRTKQLFVVSSEAKDEVGKSLTVNY
jgi:hypothetical protein